MSTRLPWCRLAAASLTWLVLTAFFAEAQTVTETSPGRISLDVEGMPLAELLLELNSVVDFEMLLVDREVENRPVTVEVEDESVKDALWEILEAANVNGIVMGEAGQAFRLFAGSAAVTGSGRNVRSLLEEEPVLSVTPPGSQTEPQRGGAAQPAGRATGDASLAVTGDAALATPPDTSRLARLAVLLGGGLMGGWVLVGGRRTP